MPKEREKYGPKFLDSASLWRQQNLLWSVQELRKHIVAKEKSIWRPLPTVINQSKRQWVLRRTAVFWFLSNKCWGCVLGWNPQPGEGSLTVSLLPLFASSSPFPAPESLPGSFPAPPKSHGILCSSWNNKLVLLSYHLIIMKKVLERLDIVLTTHKVLPPTSQLNATWYKHDD